MYTQFDAHESRSKSSRGRLCTYPPAAITLLAVLVSAILLVLLLTRPADIEVTRVVVGGGVNASCNNALIANATSCERTTDCLQGFSNGAGDACVYYPRPSTTVNCSSACYAGGSGGDAVTHCDGSGACVGDADSCVGTCSANLECAALFQFNTALLSTYDPVSFWTWGSWYNPFGCLFGRCTALVLDIFAGSSANALFTNNVTYAWTPLGALTECKEYLDADFRDTYADCLTVERYLLDASVIRTYGLFTGYANSTYPFQMSVCLYSFSCAPLSEATLSTSSVDDAQPVQTQDQWGFHAASATTDAPTGPALGLRSPQLRSAAWAQISGVFADLPLGYFDPYLYQSNVVPSPN